MHLCLLVCFYLKNILANFEVHQYIFLILLLPYLICKNIYNMLLISSSLVPHYDQVRFMPGMQRWSNTWQINECNNHINKIKDKPSSMIISINAWKVFWQSLTPFHDKNTNRWELPQPDKGHPWKNSQLTLIPDERRSFPPTIRKNTRMATGSSYGALYWRLQPGQCGKRHPD